MERVCPSLSESSKAAMVIGTDLPGLPRRCLDAARLQACRTRPVIGPSEDGGFYLLGLRRCPSGLLRGLPWSSATTGSNTVARMRSAGLAVAEAESWFDVDVPARSQAARGLLHEQRICAPRTAHFIAGLTPAEVGMSVAVSVSGPLRISVVLPVLR